MPSQEDIQQQQELLGAYRRTLAQYRKQEALNGEAFVPPAVTNGIQEARAEIQRVKVTLRSWGVIVDDYPDDTELPQVVDIPAPRRRQLRVSPAVWAGLAGALLVLVVAAVWLSRQPAQATDQPRSTSGTAIAATAAAIAALPTAEPTTLPTAQPAPVFVVNYMFDLQEIERVALVADSTMAATIPITDFLTVSRVEFGSFEATNEPAWHIGIQITNTSATPILLDLNQRFFVLNDDQGREASLVSFCCASQPGETLAPGERRDIQLLYRSVAGWYGKSSGAHTIFIRVTGLLPVVRAVWSFPPLLTAS